LQRSTVPGAEPQSADYRTALFGTNDPTQKFGQGSQTINGQVVPEHGCIGEAKKEISGDINNTGDSPVAQDALGYSLNRSMQDPRVVGVFAKWSACMKQSGYDYATPITASDDPRWSQTDMPTQAEIQTAVTDQQCRAQENVVGVWYAVDSAYETQAIEAKAETMSEAKRNIQVQLKNAARVLADS